MAAAVTVAAAMVAAWKDVDAVRKGVDVIVATVVLAVAVVVGPPDRWASTRPHTIHTI